MYYASEFSRVEDSFGSVLALTKKGKGATGLEASKILYTRQQIPLCQKHYRQLCCKKINFFDLDWDYIKDF